MPRGLKVPLEINKRGGLKTVEGSEYFKQLVMIGLQENISINPFQPGDGVSIGINPRMIYDLNSSASYPKIRYEIERWFKRKEKEGLLKLAKGSDGIRFTKKGEDTFAEINYIEIDSDKPSTVEVNVRSLQTKPVTGGGI